MMIKRNNILAYIMIIKLMLFVNATFAAPPVEQMQKSTVLVVCHLSQSEIGHGSGFVINPTDVVTNWHVVNCTSRGGRIVIFTDIKKKLSGKVKWRSESKDLAVIEASSPLGKPPVEIAMSDTVKVTDTVYAGGFPGDDFNFLDLGSFFTVKITKGTLTAKVRSREGVSLFQVDAPINPGNSGGPLFNEQGHLIGINWAKAQSIVVAINPDGTLSPMRVPSAEGVGWSIQADELINDLRALNIPFKEASVLQSSRLVLQTNILIWIIVGFIVSGIAVYFITQHIRQKDKTNKKINGLSKDSQTKKPVLEVISGPLKGLKIEFDSSPVTIGRDPKVSNLIIPQQEDKISKRHCTVRYDSLGGKFYIIDHSRNGTFLQDGTRLSDKAEFSMLPGQRFYLSTKNNLFEVRME